MSMLMGILLTGIALFVLSLTKRGIMISALFVTEMEGRDKTMVNGLELFYFF